MKITLIKPTRLLLVLSLCALCGSGYANDGVLHTFYGLNLETDGRRVASVNTSDDVVLGTPITEDFTGRCQVSLLFEPNKKDEGFVLVLRIREALNTAEDKYGVPVDHAYTIQLDEQLQFSIQTKTGLVLSGNLKLVKVPQLQIAE